MRTFLSTTVHQLVRVYVFFQFFLFTFEKLVSNETRKSFALVLFKHFYVIIWREMRKTWCKQLKGANPIRQQWIHIGFYHFLPFGYFGYHIQKNLPHVEYGGFGLWTWNSHLWWIKVQWWRAIECFMNACHLRIFDYFFAYFIKGPVFWKIKFLFQVIWICRFILNISIRFVYRILAL